MKLLNVTEWYVWVAKSGVYQFNHIEDGHVPEEQTHPTSKFKSQLVWKDWKWQKKLAYWDRSGDGSISYGSCQTLQDRITEYLSLGGLFNPELMEHEKVRDLLIDCRKHLDTEPKE